MGPVVSFLLYFFIIIIIMVIIVGLILWRFALDLEIVDVFRPSRILRQYFRQKKQEEKRLKKWKFTYADLPAPKGDDFLRDGYLEHLILKKQLDEAEEYIREMLERYKGGVTEEEQAKLEIYSHYLKVLMRIHSVISS